MPRLIALLIFAALVTGVSAAPVQAAGDPAAVPSAKTLYNEGPSGRYLVDGPWLRRLDPLNVGLLGRWQSSTSVTGWDSVSVPNAWNATDDSLTSYFGSVGWYRRDFKLPSAAADAAWVMRFEEVNFAATVWLNGTKIGSHEGAYMPFELRLPKNLVKRGAVNRMVVRVDSRRTINDLPPSERDARGKALGGWWNYAGILREVYLRSVDQIDIDSANVRPDLPCPSCAATVHWQVRLNNLGVAAKKVTLAGRFGAKRLTIGSATIAPGRSVTLRRTLRVAHPKLWSPSRPALYDASMVAAVGAKVVQRYTRHVGVRSVEVDSDGRLRLNGRKLNLRGVGLHEDAPGRGFAINNAIREKQIGWTRELGGLVMRAHYPLHPYTLERADQLGLLIWSEVPVYQIPDEQLARPSNRATAREAVKSMVEVNRDHPSIFLWSIANELAKNVSEGQRAYIATAAALAKRLDPGRPVALAVAGPVRGNCEKGYGPIDVIGFNDYYGWYTGWGGTIADRDLLSEALDSARQCYPKKALMISEYGAEASRAGPVEERGTWAFANDLINFHLAVYASKPWLSGSLYWALQELRVRPGWEGGNPLPSPPLFQKGLVTYAGAKKPTFATVSKAFHSVRQVGSLR